MKEQLKAQFNMLFEIMAEDDFTEAVSTMLWNMYTKLKEKGFTDDQAMMITTSFAKNQSGK